MWSLMLLAVSMAAGAPAPAQTDKLAFHLPTSSEPTKFDIHVDPKLISFAKDRAATYRPSHGIHGGEWTVEGPPATSMAELARYWAEDYDWAEVEAQINKRDHFGVVIPGAGNYTADIPIHFVHQKSSNDSAVPLLLLHGWSSTHLDWEEILDPLSQYFHLVTPDLPGYAFSPAPSELGMDPRTMGLAFDALMQKLGYETYGVVGTDIGYYVSSWMMSDVPEKIIGHFLDFMFVTPTPADEERYVENGTTPEENAYIDSLLAFQADHFAYSVVQDKKPLALSVAMGDSPVGFAGWLWDLKHTGSDGYDYSIEEIITETFISWIQPPYAAMRSYTETYDTGGDDFPVYDVPTGLVQWGNQDGPFPELAHFPLAPKSWTERQAPNLVYFERHTFGGHYPAKKHPELYVAHLRDFFDGL